MHLHKDEKCQSKKPIKFTEIYINGFYQTHRA